MSTNQEAAVALLLAFCVVGVLALMSGFLIVAMAWSEYDQNDYARAESGRSRPSGTMLMRRALARRCPNCGSGRLFKTYMTMNRTCPVCGVVFWQNAGEWMGPVVMDYTVAVTCALVAWIALVLLSAGEFFQMIIPAIAAAAGGAAVVPWSRSFWTLFLYVNGEMKLATRPADAARPRLLAKSGVTAKPLPERVRGAIETVTNQAD
ncbi:MAG TPA: hypothetical protein VMD75_14205 [Candidatus Binataceae bacterium]|nr:hypothetical protein [Candidatus Binataceae bacterium]